MTGFVQFQSEEGRQSFLEAVPELSSKLTATDKDNLVIYKDVATSQLAKIKSVAEQHNGKLATAQDLRPF